MCKGGGDVDKNVRDPETKTGTNKTAQTGGARKSKKKQPLWLRVARALYRFFSGLGQWIAEHTRKAWEFLKESAKRVWAFLVDFFTGLPDGLRWLFRKKKADRSFKRIKKQRQKEERKEAERELKAEQNEERRREKKKETEYKKKLREARKTPAPVLRFTLLAVLLCCILFYQLAIPAVVGAFFLKDSFKMPASNVSMQTVIGGVKQKNTLTAANAYPFGEDKLYFNMTVLADRLDIAVLDDGTHVFYTLPCGQTARFTANSRTAILNGSVVNLTAPVLLKKGTVWAPLDLLTLYTDGLNVSFAKNTLTIVQESAETPGVLYRTQYKEFRFTVCGLTPAPLP